MNIDPADKVYFKEIQYFRQKWILLLLLIATGFAWYSFILQIILGLPVGSNPAPDWATWIIWVVIGIGVPLLLYYTKLIIEVKSDKIIIKFVPFTSKTIPYSKIKKTQALTYKPIQEFGGWGIRWGSGNRRAYNVSGNQGVEIELRDGKRILLGSQNADELAANISSRINNHRDLA